MPALPDGAVDAKGGWYNAAAQKNCNFDQGESMLPHTNGSRLTRYGVVLPVEGGYVRIRKFIAQVMADVPRLPLDNVAFDHQRVDPVKAYAPLRTTVDSGAAA